jgi:trigger factor
MQTNQQTTGATVSALERRIDMTVSLAEIDKDVAERLRKLSRTIKMAGFRPGKVPLKMVEQQYGPQARSEAIGAAVEKTVGDKVREQQLRVAGYPRIEPRDGAGASELQFSAVFEIYPEIQLGDVAGREIERTTMTVGEAEVDKTIDVLRKQRTTYAAAARPAENGDKLVIDFTGRKDGTVFQGGEAKDFSMMLGGGAMLADFEKEIAGMSVGEAKTFDLTFPADYQAKDLAGQSVQFEVTVKSIEAPHLPSLDMEFAKTLGVADGDLAKMRTEVRSNLEREVRKRLQARIKNQVMEALLSVNPIEVPKALIDMESRQMADAALRDLEARGMGQKNVPIEPAWFAEGATRRVKLGLILAELVKARGLVAKPEQVRAIVDDFAETFEDSAEVVRWYYSQPQRLAEAEALAVENNVVEWMLANAKAVDKAITFDELMGNAA